MSDSFKLTLAGDDHGTGAVSSSALEEKKHNEKDVNALSHKSDDGVDDHEGVPLLHVERTSTGMRVAIGGSSLRQLLVVGWRSARSCFHIDSLNDNKSQAKFSRLVSAAFLLLACAQLADECESQQRRSIGPVGASIILLMMYLLWSMMPNPNDSDLEDDSSHGDEPFDEPQICSVAVPSLDHHAQMPQQLAVAVEAEPHGHTDAVSAQTQQPLSAKPPQAEPLVDLVAVSSLDQNAQQQPLTAEPAGAKRQTFITMVTAFASEVKATLTPHKRPDTGAFIAIFMILWLLLHEYCLWPDPSDNNRYRRYEDQFLSTSFIVATLGALLHVFRQSQGRANWSDTRFALEVPALSGVCTGLCLLHQPWIGSLSALFTLYRAWMVCRWMVIKMHRLPTSNADEVLALRWWKRTYWTEDDLRASYSSRRAHPLSRRAVAVAGVEAAAAPEAKPQHASGI